MRDAGDPRGSVLAEVNEQLLLNMIEAQTRMEAQARALQEVKRHAEIDPLTKLPNRVLLLDRCARAIAAAHRHRGRLAMLFLDIDDFKKINDRDGHAAGDRALLAAARRLMSAVRAVDTVSRFGGDEFVILLSEIAVPADAEVIAAKIIAALGIPDSEAAGLRASIGISLYPDDGLDTETLIKGADAAMYRSKGAGGGTWSRSDPRARPSARGDASGIARVHAAREIRSGQGSLPALRRIADGSYRFDIRAYGYAGSGWATKKGLQLIGADGACRFWGNVSESGGHAAASVSVRIDESAAKTTTIENAFTMQMSGVIEEGGFSLLGLGPHGVIVEIDCFGPASANAGSEESSEVDDESRAA